MIGDAGTSPTDSDWRASMPNRVARRIGIPSLVLAVAVVWLNAEYLARTTLDLWHHVVLPAFHSLFISGLGLCS